MADNKSLLILRLEGSLQSWGEDAKWDFRDSAAMPTKTGIVGLLGCALGLERGDPALRELSDALTMAVRADRPGVKFVDFQTVTGAPLMAADKSPRSVGNTVISPRAYLQDACFTVFLEMDAAWHSRILQGLREPKWPVFLGRKNCVPSRPVLECAEAAFPDLMTAVRQYPAAPRSEKTMIYETEIPDGIHAGYIRPDGMTGANRGFAQRQVWRGVIKEVQDVSDQS